MMFDQGVGRAGFRIAAGRFTQNLMPNSFVQFVIATRNHHLWRLVFMGRSGPCFEVVESRFLR